MNVTVWDAMKIDGEDYVTLRSALLQRDEDAKRIDRLEAALEEKELAAKGDAELIEHLRWKIDFDRASMPYSTYPPYPGPGRTARAAAKADN